MAQKQQDGAYAELIKKIQRKRTVLVTLTAIAAVAAILFCSPIYIKIADNVIIETHGAPFLVAAALLVLIFFTELVIGVIIDEPLRSSMDVECDPQKYLILNRRFAASRALDAANLTGLFYMGEFTQALFYADRIIANRKGYLVISAMFYKVRCMFFMGNIPEMKLAAAQYETTITNQQIKNQKQLELYRKVLDCIKFICAIADRDCNQMEFYRNKVSPWNTTKITEGFLNLLKGIAAYHLGDHEECTYRFKAVKEYCSKTILAKYAQAYLEKMDITSSENI